MELKYFFFEQAKMEYIITQKVIHLAQDVQKRTTPQKSQIQV